MSRSLLLLLLASLLDAAPIVSHSIKRATQYVTDGGFESVPKSDVGKTNFVAGGWSFQESATLYHNEGNEEDTPYGVQFAHMTSGEGNQPTGTVSQQISGLTTRKLYTLEYRERQWMPPYAEQCTFAATLGSQVIYSETLLPRTNGEIAWEARAVTFKPKTSSGIIKFKVNCPNPNSEDYGYDIQFDNISIS